MNKEIWDELQRQLEAMNLRVKKGIKSYLGYKLHVPWMIRGTV